MELLQEFLEFLLKYYLLALLLICLNAGVHIFALHFVSANNRMIV